VVDSQLRVNGVHNLRIADSTIMPRIVAVPTMPACVIIGSVWPRCWWGRGSSRREREQ
jgi:choline dehydrogenase-like flavoprotein